MHYQYTDWPDHGTPDYTHPVLSFVHLVFEKADSMGTSPTVLHCRFNNHCMYIHLFILIYTKICICNIHKSLYCYSNYQNNT